MASAITNHELIAESRLQEFLKGKDSVRSLVRSLTTGFNEADAAGIQLLNERSINTAIGVQLDAIGKIVGLTREEIEAALSDDDYRRFLFARIREQGAYGIVEDILAVARLVLNDPAATLIFTPGFPAGFVIKIEDVAVTASTCAIAALFIGGAKMAGVRGILECNAAIPTKTFKTAIVTFLDGAFDDTAGGTATVDDTSTFPDSGTLVFSEGTSDDIQAELTYTGKTPTTFTGVSAGAGDIHLDNGAVRLKRSTGDQGFAEDFTQLSVSYAGGATMTVDSTTGFPSPTGTLILSKGTSGDIEETVTYTGTSPTTFTGCVAALGNTHAIDATVVAVDSGGKLSAALDA